MGQIVVEEEEEEEAEEEDEEEEDEEEDEEEEEEEEEELKCPILGWVAVKSVSGMGLGLGWKDKRGAGTGRLITLPDCLNIPDVSK